MLLVFFFSSRRRHTSLVGDWSSDVCSSDLGVFMRRNRFSTAFAATGITLLALSSGAQAPMQAPPPPAQQQQGPPPQFQMPPASPETLKYIDELRQQIAGKENLPASEVFKNIQVMKDAPAGRLLAVMRVA